VYVLLQVLSVSYYSVTSDHRWKYFLRCLGKLSSACSHYGLCGRYVSV